MIKVKQDRWSVRAYLNSETLQMLDVRDLNVDKLTFFIDDEDEISLRLSPMTEEGGNFVRGSKEMRSVVVKNIDISDGMYDLLKQSGDEFEYFRLVPI